LQSVVAIITAFSIIIHFTVGCCGHHAHEATACASVSHHTHECNESLGYAHAHEMLATPSGHEPTPDSQPHADCHETHCSAILSGNGSMVLESLRCCSWSEAFATTVVSSISASHITEPFCCCSNRAQQSYLTRHLHFLS
jgi:hypothetical protein